ncbi:MAG: PEP-CTERM sorting domain-containing protein [Methyloprofundus sp.]|nr:PEP-CTERM sorting domain-containing protein [Methyloprofundus sp.]
MIIKKAILGAGLGLLSCTANASSILFVSDNTADTSIATVLSSAGHTVTSSLNQYTPATEETTALLGNLSSYDAVFWSATGTGFGSLHNSATMYANLNNYISGGGSIFVTGYDSVSSPIDTALISFLGGSSTLDDRNQPQAISSVITSLTMGVRDIRGLTPTTSGNQTNDRDSIGGLNANTIGIVGSGSSILGLYQWTLQSVGLGEIAYVSNGNHKDDSESTSWANASSVYNAALLNFAFNSGSDAHVPEPTTLTLLAFSLVGIGFSKKKNITA